MLPFGCNKVRADGRLSHKRHVPHYMRCIELRLASGASSYEVPSRTLGAYGLRLSSSAELCRANARVVSIIGACSSLIGLMDDSILQVTSQCLPK